MNTKMCAAVAAMTLTGAAVGQTDQLFLYDQGNNNGFMYVIQNGKILDKWATDTYEFCPFVATEGDGQPVIRITGWRDVPGAEYTFGGEKTGQEIGALDFLEPGQYIYDASTDGRNIYGVSLPEGILYRFDMFFENHSPIKNISKDWNQWPGGIAYDSKANTLWVSGWFDRSVREYDMLGNKTGRGFEADEHEIAAMAYEPSTDTLWIVPRGPKQELVLHQYSTTGQLLLKKELLRNDGTHIYGYWQSAEFEITPTIDCYADFTGDGALDLFDFLGFVNAFNAGDPGADCDGDDGLTLFDFLCFTNAFNEGC